MTPSVYLICLGLLIQNVLSQQNNKCNTPNNHEGVCINIKNCTVLQAMLENPNKSSSDEIFLKNSLCGHDNEDTNVCCSTNVNHTSSINYNSQGYETVSSSKLPSQSTCGQVLNTFVNRIINGRKSVLGAWPWMVAIGFRDKLKPDNLPLWLCGGSLISDKYVVTAAHCTVDFSSRQLPFARLGDLNLDQTVEDDATPVDIPIERIIIHEQYNTQPITNDIALLKLERTVMFNVLIQPICLPILSNIRNTNLVNEFLNVAGWGATEFKGSFSNDLMEIMLSVIDETKCKEAFSKIKTAMIDERVMCAKDYSNKKDSCQGDSGGPLMWPSDNRYYLMGVVSYGFECTKPGYPGVYTRVTHYVEWIVNNLNKS